MRTEAQVYFETGRRYLEAAKVIFQTVDYWEVVYFLCYHAFECMASAGLAERRNEVPRQHAAKIKAFQNLYQRGSFSREINLCVQIVSASQREWALYPQVSGFAFVSPAVRFDRPIALSAVIRVDRLFRRMEQEI
jgi:uncharacterized protein (UPF0332 family)